MGAWHARNVNARSSLTFGIPIEERTSSLPRIHLAKPSAKATILSQYRKGEIDVLVTCRALDEGFNVPETELGIIAASTATRRQRIQRLGRVVRPAKGKVGASIYTLVATGPEIDRLKEEEAHLDGVATVLWSRA